MYALLDFGDLRIEQRTEFSQVKSYYQGKLVDDYKSYCKVGCFDSIQKFFKGIIGNCAFHGCESLTNIIIPDSVTSIGSNAFWGTNITNIVIPNNITRIGSKLFYVCRVLKEIEWKGRTYTNSDKFNKALQDAGIAKDNVWC